MLNAHSHISCASADEAVDALQLRHAAAVDALRAALDRFFTVGTPPSGLERAAFRYPELRVSYHPKVIPPANRRAFAKFPAPGVFVTTVTQPEAFRSYLLEQLRR